MKIGLNRLRTILLDTGDPGRRKSVERQRIYETEGEECGSQRRVVWVLGVRTMTVMEEEEEKIGSGTFILMMNDGGKEVKAKYKT